MKPAPFAYHDPDTVDEALALLAEHGDDAKLLAGGQSLGPMLNMRVVSPAVVIDLNRVSALDYRRGSPEGFAIGALARQSHLEDDPAFATSQPLAAAALPWIAHRPIRNRGTVAGSLVHADPAAEWGGLVLALDARFEVRRGGGEAARTVAAEDFFTGILETAVGPEELLAEIRLPPWPAGTRWGFREFARRRGDFALAGVACRFEVDRAGGCRSVRIGLIGVGDTPLRGWRAESVLEGEPPGPAAFAAAAEAVREEVEPLDDGHASAEYRRHLAGVLVEDALADAWGREAPAERRAEGDGGEEAG